MKALIQRVTTAKVTGNAILSQCDWFHLEYFNKIRVFYMQLMTNLSAVLAEVCVFWLELARMTPKRMLITCKRKKLPLHELCFHIM